MFDDVLPSHLSHLGAGKDCHVLVAVLFVTASGLVAVIGHRQRFCPLPRAATSKESSADSIASSTLFTAMDVKNAFVSPSHPLRLLHAVHRSGCDSFPSRIAARVAGAWASLSMPHGENEEIRKFGI